MRSLLFVAVCGMLVACNRSGGGGGSVSLASQEDSVSYIVGFQIGGTLKQQAIPVKLDIVMNGLRDAVGGKKSALTNDQMRATLVGYQQKAMEAQRHRDSTSAATNVAEGEKFLADNKKAEGVQTTASGLQWKVLKEGTGPHPKSTSVATVHYKGTLLNGDEFDSSYGREPASFPLNQVIPGWTEAVQLMNAGAKYKFWIPSKLAYGPNGSPPRIGPNATLIFEVELLSFK